MIGLSLFTGYGGLDLALQDYLSGVLAYVEIEEYAQKNIAYRMADGLLPRAPILSDVKNVSGSSGDCEIIYGGFPCQDISVAGNGKGLEGERSGLFFEIIRLTKEIRPSFVFLENVPAIRTRGLEQVIKAFAEIRYDCRWTMLSAASIGAPHKRERWFLLANTNTPGRLWPDTSQSEKRYSDFKPIGSSDVSNTYDNGFWVDGKQVSEQKCESATVIRGDGKNESVAYADESGLEGLVRKESSHTRVAKSFGKEWWSIEPDVGRVVDGCAFELDLIEEIKIDEEKNNTKKIAKIGEFSRKVLQAMWNNREVATSSHNLYRERFYNCLSELPQRITQNRGNMGAWIKRDKDLCNMLCEFCSETFKESEDLQQKLLEKLRQIKREQKMESSFRSDRIKALGNGVVPLQARTAFELLMGVVK